MNHLVGGREEGMIMKFSRRVPSATNWSWVGRQREAEALGRKKSDKALESGR